MFQSIQQASHIISGQIKTSPITRIFQSLPQITIPIAQFVENANQSKAIRIFYQIADFLLLIHFTMDPYIYVLLRTNYWIRFKGFLSQLRLKKEDDFAELPKTDPNHHF